MEVLTLEKEVGKIHSAVKTDDNRARRLQAIRLLERLLTEATDMTFTGSVVLELNSKDGHLGRVKTQRIRHHGEHE